MYTHSNASLPRSAESLAHFLSPQDASTPSPMQYAAAPQPQHHQVALGEFDSEASSNNTYNSCSSGCTSYMGSPSSLASYESRRVQRSVSSHSLQKNGGGLHHPFSPLFAQLLDSQNGPVRRACSTGDLQRFHGMQYYHHSDSPLSSESSLIIEEMSRTSPYSPEEKKVRIERYRSKRNQRNFGKKIKYACRKTLADSRPRIRGRFAKNEEIAMNPPVQWSHMGTGEEEDEEEDNWANFFDSIVPANLGQEPHGSSSSFGAFY
ncbi:hypothetical protein V8G54_024970 [Vigna mungo]|uniref:CCT domain-containing protein n=1 Tax=Vigna mungo TaxID=3915 RepID=A0AAQ3RQM2_VIGMU